MKKSEGMGARRWRGVAVMLALVLALGAGVAEARKGGSFGSRGTRTYQAPMATPTAPGTAAPMQRSATPQQASPSAGAPAAQAARSGGMFSRGGFMPGLMGGLLGAGLFGMLFGGGFFGGLGSLAGVLGFLLQIVLVVVVVRLAMNFFRSRQAPAYAGAGAAPMGGRTAPGPRPMAGRSAGAARPARSGVRDEIGITTADYSAFESTLRTVQTAYGQEDLATLQRALTPEMYGYFAEEIEANRAQGRANRLSDISFLQGDLAEAWREGGTEYATVAMRYSMKDWTEDRASGAVVAGDRDRPEQVTEIWTFSRPRGGEWVLSAIQQTS